MMGIAGHRVVRADSVVTVWNNAALQAIRDTKPGPPIAARALAVLHTAIYDAWAAYDAQAVGTRLGGDLRQPETLRTDANRQEAISYAAYRTLTTLFPQPAEVTMFQSILVSTLHYSISNVADLDPGVACGVGNRAAQAVLDFRRSDGANADGTLTASGVPYADYSGYTTPNTPTQINDPNLWQPLTIPNGNGGFTTQKMVTPFWGQVTPFALTSGSQFRPDVGPARFDVAKPISDPANARYVLQAKQILQYAANLTDKQKVIAEYWADGPASELPPGHWCLFAQFVSQRDGYSIADDSKLFSP